MGEPGQVGAVGDGRVEHDARLVRVVAKVEKDHRFEVVCGVEVPGCHPVEHEVSCCLYLRRVDIDVSSVKAVEGLSTVPRGP